MRVGVSKEIKAHEHRVGLVPASVREIVRVGGQVFVETKAGEGIGIADEAYVTAGATILPSAEDIFAISDLIIKVKEPQPHECRQFRAGQTLFTYLHLAPDPEQAALLQASGVTAIAYETVTDEQGGLPLLTPMSQVAGRMSVQAGAHCLESAQGGLGVLLGGVPGVPPGRVVILGGGVVGEHAAKMALGLGASVAVFDRSLPRLQVLDRAYGPKLETVYATNAMIESYVMHADLVIGAVLVPGSKAPKLVTRDILNKMRRGAVMVDVAIDQGGCFETSRPTTHDHPTYVVDGIVHYCVANMPGAVPRTSTLALNHATLPFILSLVTKGVETALDDHVHLLNGLNIYQGYVTHPAVADALHQPYTNPKNLIDKKQI